MTQYKSNICYICCSETEICALKNKETAGIRSANILGCIVTERKRKIYQANNNGNLTVHNICKE